MLEEQRNRPARNEVRPRSRLPDDCRACGHWKQTHTEEDGGEEDCPYCPCRKYVDPRKGLLFRLRAGFRRAVADLKLRLRRRAERLER